MTLKLSTINIIPLPKINISGYNKAKLLVNNEGFQMICHQVIYTTDYGYITNGNKILNTRAW